MKIASLFSGGKDSAYALFCAMQQGYDVRTLVTLYPQADSMMFHYPNVDLTQLQAEAIGIPHATKRTSAGEKNELDALRELLRGLKVDAVVSGAVESEYQKQRIDLICDELGMRSFAPLWRKKPIPLLREMLDAGLEIIVTAASAEGLGKEWLGRKLDAAAVSELEKLQKTKGVHPLFEGGEGETLVTCAPFFRKRLVIEKAEKKWSGSSGMLHIKKASLA
ncbi:MAG: diphthine--ammonia ligase [Candidatus Burarchaeum sp.]|nr:diphthine--ammonia ligase [Candidatus Burarchaeum sp.]MDO8339332.1 diphthine--ammonia ligase [Candidatus Burarchaeum sp.]